MSINAYKVAHVRGARVPFVSLSWGGSRDTRSLMVQRRLRLWQITDVHRKPNHLIQRQRSSLGPRAIEGGIVVQVTASRGNQAFVPRELERVRGQSNSSRRCCARPQIRAASVGPGASGHKPATASNAVAIDCRSVTACRISSASPVVAARSRHHVHRETRSPARPAPLQCRAGCRTPSHSPRLPSSGPARPDCCQESA